MSNVVELRPGMPTTVLGLLKKLGMQHCVFVREVGSLHLEMTPELEARLIEVLQSALAHESGVDRIADLLEPDS